MKKYNTPEMKVSMFDGESIATATTPSETLATYNYYVGQDGVMSKDFEWGKDISITF